MTLPSVDYLCPVCFQGAQMGITEGSMTRLFCFKCEVSWHVDEPEPNLGPLATLGDCVAVEPPRRRPSGSGCKPKRSM